RPGDEGVALSLGRWSAFQEQRARVCLEDLHGTVGPAEALLLEIDEGVGHQAAAVARGYEGGIEAALEDAQAELRILGDAPLGPAATTHQLRAPHHGHGAVLDDGVALVARDHADVEEAAVLGVAHGLEGAHDLVAVVLRSLHDRAAPVTETGLHSQ